MPPWGRGTRRRADVGCGFGILTPLTLSATSSCTHATHNGTPIVTTRDGYAIGFLGLSVKQWSSLLNLLNNHSNSDKLSSKIDSVWILDLSCSHHMSSRRDFFSKLKPTAPYIIGLPNGTRQCILEVRIYYP